MIIYLLNLFIVYAMSWLHDKSNNKYIRLTLITIAISSLICISGFRENVGTDFSTYYVFFENIVNYDWSILFTDKYYDVTSFEKGFTILVLILGKVFNNPRFIMVAIGCITIIPIVLTMKKYTKSFSLSIFLYITTMNYYSAFNGIRQWIACMILFVAIRYIYEKDKFKYIICVLLASTIHTSAIICIPLYYFVNLKPFTRKYTIICLGLCFCIFNLDIVLNILSQSLPSEYQSYFVASQNDRGINSLRIIVAFAPVLISFIYYKRLTKVDDNVNIIINFSAINFIIKIIATQKNILNRFSLYFDIYNVLLIPLFVYIFSKKESRIIKIIIMVLYLLNMILLLPKQSNLIPYKSILF